jgi:hypothetical protein
MADAMADEKQIVRSRKPKQPIAKLRTAVEAELSSKQKKIMARKKQLATKSTEKATKAA